MKVGQSAAVMWSVIPAGRWILRTSRNNIWRLNSFYHIYRLFCNHLSALQIKVLRNMKEQVLQGLPIRRRSCRAVHYKLFW